MKKIIFDSEMLGYGLNKHEEERWPDIWQTVNNTILKSQKVIAKKSDVFIQRC